LEIKDGKIGKGRKNDVFECFLHRKEQKKDVFECFLHRKEQKNDIFE
jgi:hypothetical protein